MVQLRVLNGSRAGTAYMASRFPVTIGRASEDDLQVIEPGVWDQHLQLDFQLPDGFRLRRLGEGRASVNGAEFDELTLRNGDVIDLGAAKLQFWLGEVRQSNNRLRETLFWLALVGLVIVELFLLGALR